MLGRFRILCVVILSGFSLIGAGIQVFQITADRFNCHKFGVLPLFLGPPIALTQVDPFVQAGGAGGDAGGLFDALLPFTVGAAFLNLI